MTRRQRARIALVALVVSVACFVPAMARADAAAARALFDDARKLAASGAFQAACPKFEESYKLDPGMGTLFNLADCWEHLGKTASAWVRFREVADAAGRAGQADREKIARSRAAALESKLSRMIVQVKAPSGVEVTKDGVAFGSAQWDTPIPVDPGAHTVEAKASGKLPWNQTVEVPPNGSTTVVVPPLEPAPPEKTAKAAGAAVSVGTTVPSADTGAPSTASSWNGQKTAAVILGGVGVAAGVFAVIKLVDYNDKVDSANGICKDACREPANTQAKSILDDARSVRTQAIVAGAIGGASLIGGAVLWFTSSPSTQATARWKWQPIVGTQVQGISVSGVW
jgi:serine/threonine-protein kinase